MRISDWSSDVCSSDLTSLQSGNIGHCHQAAIKESRTGHHSPLGLAATLNQCTKGGLPNEVEDDCRLARYGRAWLPCHARFRPGRYGCCSGRSVRRDRVPEGAARIDAGSDRRPAEGEEEQRSEEHTSELQSLMRISY